MTPEMSTRFLKELRRMSRRGLRRYRAIVGDELVRAILRTLSISEKKWLYSQILREQAKKNFFILCYKTLARWYISVWSNFRRRPTNAQ
jgi:hypothetical protein